MLQALVVWHLLRQNQTKKIIASSRLKMTIAATFIFKQETYLILVTQAYCVKCKSKRDMKNEKQVTMKNGRQALSGACSVCGTKMFKIGGSKSGDSIAAKQRLKVKAASKKPAGRTTKARKSKTKSKK